MNPLLGQATPVETTSRWVSMATWPQTLELIVLAVAVVVIALAIFNARLLASARRRVALVALRVLLVASLLMVFLQPALLVEERAYEASHVHLLLDTSSSMNQPVGGPGSPTRLEAMSVFIDQHRDLLDGLGREHNLHVHGFDTALSSLGAIPAGSGLASLDAQGQGTHLIAALEALEERHQGDHVAAVIVLTDGIDTSDHGAGPELDHSAGQSLEALGAPLHLVVPDPSPELRDVAVRDLGTSGFAFLMNATSIEARLEARGLEGVALNLELLLDGRVVTTREYTPSTAYVEETLRFDFVPRRLGEVVVALRALPTQGEVHLGNNLVERPIQVIRDRIRVLQIVGQPSWDERFLRNHLKEDPNVELISFFILVNPLSFRPLDAADTALIPFPARELFEEELGGFDLVIFQNFNYGPFQTRQYLPHIARYVREGGAFLMIGGPLSLASGGYYGTPITEVLPVTIPAGFSSESLVDLRTFRPSLTEAGLLHPAIRLATDPAVHRATFEGLEPLHGVNLVTGAHPEAVILASHPKLRDQNGAPMPVIAVREVGQGRTMVVATDSTWRWHFLRGNQGGDAHVHARFWKSAMRWLIRDPETALIQVDVEGDRHELGPPGEAPRQARVQIKVVGPDFRPAVDHRVDLVARRRDEGGALGAGEVVLARDDLRTDGAGMIEAKIPLMRAGVMEVSATTQLVGGRAGSASDLFVVQGGTSEEQRSVADSAWLGALQSATGGSVQTFSTSNPSFSTAQAPPRSTLSRRHHEVWTSAWVLLWVALVAGTEWWCRRRWGLL
jgi:uncharacterized membrane protein